MGFDDYTIEVDSEHRRGTIFIHNNPVLIKENLPLIVDSLNQLIQLIGRQKGWEPLFVDVNNYRRERENLIVELARATARKALATKQELPMPAMNAYERRLAHLELSTHPDVKTESVGKGHNRFVVVKPISAETSDQPKDETAGYSPSESQ